jgi:acyl-CoA reductase-like NAD-dependent aldehyde dehydrogenase
MKVQDRFFVNGGWVAPSTRDTIAVYDAGHGTVMGRVAAGKQSGYGREAGAYGLEEFLEYKSLQLKG